MKAKESQQKANNEEKRNGQKEHFVAYQHTNETEEMFIIMLRIKVDELTIANNAE